LLESNARTERARQRHARRRNAATSSARCSRALVWFALLGLGVGAWLGAGQQPAAAQASAVRVTREAPVVTRTEFDPLHRPRNVPVFGPHESGLCNAAFEIHTSIAYSVESVSRKNVRVRPTGIEVVTRLKLDIYTLDGVPAKVHAHEEAHRQISEHYYKDAVAVARKLGEPLIGKPFAGKGATPSAAEKDAFGKIVTAYNESYFARTRMRSAAANERFDEITDHGRNAITEADAMARAIATDP
jgi:hypothetical protein